MDCIQYGTSACLSVGFKRTSETLAGQRWIFLEDPTRLSRSTHTDALSMNRKDLREVVGFITRHWSFYRNLNRMGLHMETLRCRKCGMGPIHACTFWPPGPIYAFNSRGPSEVGEEEVGRQDDIGRRVSGICTDEGFDGIGRTVNNKRCTIS